MGSEMCIRDRKCNMKKIFRKIHGTRKIFVALPGIVILIQNEKVGSW